MIFDSLIKINSKEKIGFNINKLLKGINYGY